MEDFSQIAECFVEVVALCSSVVLDYIVEKDLQLLLCLLDEYLQISEADVWETGGRRSCRGVRACGSCGGSCGLG